MGEGRGVYNFSLGNSLLRIFSKMALQECNVNILAPLLGWMFRCEFWEVNFSSVNFWGAFTGNTSSQKIDPRIRPPKLFGAQTFASWNSTLNSGSRGATSPQWRCVHEEVLSWPRSQTESLTKENLVRLRTAPTAIWKTSLSLLRENSVSFVRIHFP